MQILVVEDQVKVAQSLKKGLGEVGYSVELAGNGAEAESSLQNKAYDLVILDVMLPDQSGLDTARNFRTKGYEGPILMLTALSTTKDKVQGLDAGADDYLTKPYSFDELHARIRALLRRKVSSANINQHLSYKDLELDIIHRIAKRQGVEIPLTSKEFNLLEYFMRHPEKPLDRSSIAKQVWGIHFDSESNVIDVYVNLLRKKIDSPFSKRLINTVVGVGYVLKENT